MNIQLNFEADINICTNCATDEHIFLEQTDSGHSIVSTLVCKKCVKNASTKQTLSTLYDFTILIKEWNRKNDIDALIQVKEKELLELSKTLENLKTIKKTQSSEFIFVKE